MVLTLLAAIDCGWQSVAIVDEGFLGWGDGGLVCFALELFVEVCLGGGYEAWGHEEVDGGEGEGFGGDDHAVLADGGAGGGGGLPGVRGDAGDEGGRAEADGRDVPADVAYVGGGGGGVGVEGTQGKDDVGLVEAECTSRGE